MSIAHLSYVMCDECAEPASIGGEFKEARILAFNEGWRRVERRDLCPNCINA